MSPKFTNTSSPSPVPAALEPFTVRYCAIAVAASPATAGSTSGSATVSRPSRVTVTLVACGSHTS